MKLKILGLSFVLFLIALPLVSWGAWQDRSVLWYTGLALMGIAAVLPPFTRLFDEEKDEKGKRSDGAPQATQRPREPGKDTGRSKAAAPGGDWPKEDQVRRVRSGASPGAAPRADVPRRARDQAEKARSGSDRPAGASRRKSRETTGQPGSKKKT